MKWLTTSKSPVLTASHKASSAWQSFTSAYKTNGDSHSTNGTQAESVAE